MQLAGEGLQGLIAAQLVFCVYALREEPLRWRQSCPGGSDFGGRDVARQAHRIAAGHKALQLPDRRAQRRIQHAQRSRVHLEGLGERIDRDVVRQLDGGILRIRQAADRAKEGFRVAIHLQGREERDVEISRREPEGRPLVALDDDSDIARPQILLRAPQTAGPVVVRGDREWPGAEQVVVIEHQVGRSLGRTIRIEALIDQAVDAHEATRGSRHELPQARSADTRIGGRIEGGLDVRQGRDLGRDTALLQGLRDTRFPQLRADQSLVEAVRLPELEADPVYRIEELLRGRALAERFEDALLVQA